MNEATGKEGSVESLKHWKLTRDADNIAWAYIDQQDASTNTLGSAVIGEFAQLLGALEDAVPRGLVILSGKENGFIAGADLEEYAKLEGVDAVKHIVKRNWDLFDRLEALPFPSLALIKGHCMGGGLELALACRYRIGVDDPATRLSLPEVMLGIVPGWGGMRRLPRLIGPSLAMDMMLSGKALDARRAVKAGLTDECVPQRVMLLAARNRVLRAPLPHRPKWIQRTLNGPLKKAVEIVVGRQLKKRAKREHYPAPYAILETWYRYDGDWLAMPASDQASLEHIFAHPTARNLVRVFFLQQRLKNFGKQSEAAKCCEDPFKVRHVHVIGAGIMGGDIAAWCAQRGLNVSLQDQSIEKIAPAMTRAAQQFAKKYRGDTRAARFAMDRLMPDPNGAGLQHADVVIEAIFENLDAKHRLFKEIERQVKPGAVIATNTSSLRLEDIGSVLEDPSRLVGIHFFNPVAKMPLVEVVTGAQTDAVQAERAMVFVHQLDKLPLPVKSCPGFLVNAVLRPYMQEALQCVDEGIAPEVVDAAACEFGMPIGPIELVDMVGLDITLSAGKGFDINVPVSRRLSELIGAGHLGRKSGQGYYIWKDGAAVKSAPGNVPANLAERLIRPLLNAAQECLDAEVVADADLVDAGVIFGTGFAPFTGGPIHYLNRS